MITPTLASLQARYRPDIDGLRAVAVLSVVVFHAFPDWMKGGFTGVDIFFVISGFLISTVVFENLDNGTFRFTDFYARRIRRIFPALIVVLCFCLLFGWFVLIAEELNQLGKHIAAGAGFVSNLVLWNEAGYFDHSSDTKPLLHLWSLGIEEQFYIFWPFIIWLAWRRSFNILTLIIMLALVSFALNISKVDQDPVATFYSPQTRFWELLCGSLLAYAALYGRDFHATYIAGPGARLSSLFYRNGVETNRNSLNNAASIVGSLLVAYGLYKIDKDIDFPGNWAVIPVFGTVLIIASGPKAWINRNILSNTVAVWIGKISFPLYLWHWPLLSFAHIIENKAPDLGIRLGAVSLSVLLALMTFKFVEQPIRYVNRNAKTKLYALCGAMLVLGGTGLFVSQSKFSESHGFEDLLIKRKGFEHAFGSSHSWFRGKDDWLFLGNS